MGKPRNREKRDNKKRKPKGWLKTKRSTKIELSQERMPKEWVKWVSVIALTLTIASIATTLLNMHQMNEHYEEFITYTENESATSDIMDMFSSYTQLT